MHWDPILPIYQQLREKTVAAVLDGTLAEGEALPSVRQLAVDFKVNPLTVSKAYQWLVDDDLIEARRGDGMFVREGGQARRHTSERSHFVDAEWPCLTRRDE